MDVEKESSNAIYKTLYIILHIVFTIFEVIFNVYIKICHEFATLIRGCVRGLRNTTTSKVPVHLTVLLGHEEPSYSHLADLVLWCLSSKIPYISFYDYGGILKENEGHLRREVEKKRHKSDHIVWHGNGAKNGFVGQKVHVKVLSEKDGRAGLVSLSKILTLSEIKTDFNIQKLDWLLRRNYEFPDPDLGVCCGKSFSLLGYPPWQIRVTEFLIVDSHVSITLDMFNTLIAEYVKREQRFGK